MVSPYDSIPVAARSVRSLMLDRREGLVDAWSTWLGVRLETAPTVTRPTLRREFSLIISVLAEMVGPTRRESKAVWAHVCDHYGRVAAMRGLAAGEVVEELHYLRQLLILDLTPELRRTRPRRSMAALLRMNHVLDEGVALAVVGYTDVLVATLFAHNGVPAPHTNHDPAEIERQLLELEEELHTATAVSM